MKRNKQLENLAEQTIRRHIRAQLVKEGNYYTPGTRSAEFAKEQQLCEFDGILETVKQYAKNYDTSSFSVLDELMALVEGESQGDKVIGVGDTVKMTWINEGVSREDVKVVLSRPNELEVKIMGESDSHKFVKNGEHWFSVGDMNDPIKVEEK